MIATLTGTIRHLTADKAVIDVAGVGYLVSIHARTSSTLTVGAQHTIHTSMVVREDSMSLFGFHTEDEKSAFETVQTVTGIGPKVALAITSALSPEQLFTAIASENVALIEKVPGIGKKGAQRLVLELKGKVSPASPSNHVVSHPVHDDLVAALTGLGYTAREADEAVSNTFAQLSEEGVDLSATPLSELLKIALRNGK
jgi:Holliday junction DNA helicase RuvA